VFLTGRDEVVRVQGERRARADAVQFMEAITPPGSPSLADGNAGLTDPQKRSGSCSQSSQPTRPRSAIGFRNKRLYVEVDMVLKNGAGYYLLALAAAASWWCCVPGHAPQLKFFAALFNTPLQPASHITCGMCSCGHALLASLLRATAQPEPCLIAD
jgi:hypothetical protein